jgi:hypothetical protein
LIGSNGHAATSLAKSTYLSLSVLRFCASFGLPCAPNRTKSTSRSSSATKTRMQIERRAQVSNRHENECPVRCGDDVLPWRTPRHAISVSKPTEHLERPLYGRPGATYGCRSMCGNRSGRLGPRGTQEVVSGCEDAQRLRMASRSVTSI